MIPGTGAVPRLELDTSELGQAICRSPGCVGLLSWSPSWQSTGKEGDYQQPSPSWRPGGLEGKMRVPLSRGWIALCLCVVGWLWPAGRCPPSCSVRFSQRPPVQRPTASPWRRTPSTPRQRAACTTRAPMSSWTPAAVRCAALQPGTNTRLLISAGLVPKKS